MKHWKQLLALLTVAALALALVACGGSAAGESADSGETGISEASAVKETEAPEESGNDTDNAESAGPVAPGEAPALRSMFTGHVPEQHVAHHNPLWAEELGLNRHG